MTEQGSKFYPIPGAYVARKLSTPLTCSTEFLFSNEHPNLEAVARNALTENTSVGETRSFVFSEVHKIFERYTEPTGFAVYDAERLITDCLLWQLNLLEQFDVHIALRALTTPTVEALRSVDLGGSLGPAIDLELEWRAFKLDSYEWTWSPRNSRYGSYTVRHFDSVRVTP